MTVYLIRHGETQSNVERRFQGRAPVPLTARGREQAGRLAAFLASVPFSGKVFSSPALRAQQTAEILAKTLQVEVMSADALAEVDCGSWQGQTFTQVEAQDERYAQWRSTPTIFKFPAGETLGEVQKRVGTFFDRAVSEHRGTNLVMVSHAATLTALVAHIFRWSLADTWQEGRAIHANTAFSKLELNDQTGGVIAFELARTDHLEADP